MSLISSDRLDLIPLNQDMLASSLEGRLAEVELWLDARLPTGWPDHRDVFQLRLDQLREKPELLPWLLRAMVLRESREVIGHVGFHTAPGAEYLEPFSPGAVEFGFTVYPEFRRRGFAREAALALMRWATEQHGVGRFVLSIRPDNLPSQALARGLDFVKIGSHIDDVDGEEDVLELKERG
jgi:[ribosomal protein S5]-alanine N-acetyltransferase